MAETTSVRGATTAAAATATVVTAVSAVMSNSTQRQLCVVQLARHGSAWSSTIRQSNVRMSLALAVTSDLRDELLLRNYEWLRGRSLRPMHRQAALQYTSAHCWVATTGRSRGPKFCALASCKPTPRCPCPAGHGG